MIHKWQINKRPVKWVELQACWHISHNAPRIVFFISTSWHHLGYFFRLYKSSSQSCAMSFYFIYSAHRQIMISDIERKTVKTVPKTAFWQKETSWRTRLSWLSYVTTFSTGLVVLCSVNWTSDWWHPSLTQGSLTGMFSRDCNWISWASSVDFCLSSHAEKNALWQTVHITL